MRVSPIERSVNSALYTCSSGRATQKPFGGKVVLVSGFAGIKHLFASFKKILFVRTESEQEQILDTLGQNTYVT